MISIASNSTPEAPLNTILPKSGSVEGFALHIHQAAAQQQAAEKFFWRGLRPSKPPRQKPSGKVLPLDRVWLKQAREQPVELRRVAVELIVQLDHPRGLIAPPPDRLREGILGDDSLGAQE